MKWIIIETSASSLWYFCFWKQISDTSSEQKIYKKSIKDYTYNVFQMMHMLGK